MDASLLGAARDAPAGMGMAEGGPFPLTLRDVFTNTHVVQVTPETKIWEVKELLRAAKREPVEYADSLVLLYNQRPLDDDSTVGSHGLSHGVKLVEPLMAQVAGAIVSLFLTARGVGHGARS